jgi:hypothetical protein
MRYMHKFSERRLEAILFVFITLAYSFLSANGQTTTAPTVVNVTSQIQQANVNRLGIVLGDQNYGNSGQLMKNLVSINPGLEATEYRSVLSCSAATAETCQFANAATAEPAGFWNGAHYEVLSGGAAGATGTVVSSTAGGVSVLTLDKSVSLSAGDYLSVDVVKSGNGIGGWTSSVAGGATITAETTDLAPETPGKQAALLSALGRESARLSQEIGAQSGQSQVLINGDYEISFRAKAVGGNNQLNVNVAREASGSAPYLNRSVALTDGWAQYTLTLSASETGTQSSPLLISFTAAGANIELDDVSLQQSNSSSANNTPFLDEAVNAAQELHPGTIRTAPSNSDVLTQLESPFARPSQGLISGVTSAPGTAYGIQELLQLCAAVGADPWITVSAATTPAEMTDLVQYLTGDGSDSWSALRIARGQVDPWTSVFSKIHIELENGAGIIGTANQPMAPSAYASWSNTVFAAARRSTGYSASKFDLVLSGSGASTTWNAAVLSASRQQDSLAIAPSLLLSPNAQGAPFGPLFAEPQLFNAPGGVVFSNLQMGAAAPSGSSNSTQVNVSDSPLGSITGAITQAQLNQLTPTLGLGIAQANSMLQMLRSGVKYQNSSVFAQNGLTCNDGSTPSNCRIPEFLTQALANTVIGGNMLQTVQSGANPTWTQPITAGVQLKGGNLLQSFAFDNGTSRSVVVINLSQTASLPVTFSGADAPAGTVQMTQITSPDITDNNETADVVAPATQTLSGFNATNALSLPPFSMTVLSWTPAAVQVGAAAPSTTTSTPSKTSETVVKASPLAAVAVTAATASTSAQPVISCASGFSSSGDCGVSLDGWSPNAFIVRSATDAFSGSQVNFIPSASTHVASGFIYQTPVNVQAFTSTFTFVPNGQNISFVLQNNTDTNSGSAGPQFVAGAGCEGGFYQAYGTAPANPNNIFALELDSYSPLTSNGSFTYSSAQVYQQGQSPCNPNDGGPNYYSTNKISTSPVPLDSSPSSQGTTTGHTYSATVTYDGANVTLSMYDVTAGGACPGSTCFTHTWSGVNIPSLVGSNTAYVELTGATGLESTSPLMVDSLTYATLPAPATPTYSTYTTNAGASYASAPVFSPAAGSYSGTQNVTISNSTSGSYFCYVLSSTVPTLLPQTDNQGGCIVGTLYTGPVSVSSSQTLYAMAGTVYTGLPSALTAGAYVIGGTTSTSAAAPGFSPSSGTYTSAQAVTITDSTPGATIYYTTNGTTPTTSSAVYTAPITVDSTETLEAIAVVPATASATADVATAAATASTVASPVASASYTITGSTAAPTFSLAGGTYTSSQTVSISDATSGATIYYTTNGTTPTTSSTKYTGAITVSATETIEAIAVATGYNNSSVAEATYTIGSSSSITGATVINYGKGFTAASHMIYNGSAQLNGSSVDLTNGGLDQAGSAWYATPVNIQSFNTTFTFQLTDPSADGFTFTIQDQGPGALGGIGEGLGFSYIQKSVGIKYDMYSNAGEGPDSTGVYFNGAVPTMPAANLSDTPINLHSGDTMTVQFVYNGTDLTMTITDTVTKGTYTASYPINIPAIVGAKTAYVGFTGGTGGLSSTQAIKGWTLSN